MKPSKISESLISDLPPNLQAKFRSSDPEIQNFILALIKENLKLQKQIAKLQAENISLKNRIKVLEKENLKPKVQVSFVPATDQNLPPEYKQQKENNHG